MAGQALDRGSDAPGHREDVADGPRPSGNSNLPNIKMQLVDMGKIQKQQNKKISDSKSLRNLGGNRKLVPLYVVYID